MSENSASDFLPKKALTFSLPLAALVAIASLGGLLLQEVYQMETADWRAQSTAQDLVDLFLIVPVLTIAALFAYRGERLAQPIWGGSLLYVVYTFIIYCFAVHFNRLFLVYVGSLGLSSWGLIYFFRVQPSSQAAQRSSSQPVQRVIAIYFLVFATLFYLLWLSEVVPALWSGKPPASLAIAGLTTNPVHVLDLSLVLPGIFLTGYLLLKNHPIGHLLTPVLLVFFILMDVTIAAIFLVQYSNGAAFNLPGVLTMAVLAISSLIALLWFLRRSEG